MTGVLIGIAVRTKRKAPVTLRDAAFVSTDGIDGDHAGKRLDRAVSILASEDWAKACADLHPPADPERDLRWTARRANLLLRGLRLPRAAGARLLVGPVELEVRHQTYPCKRMEDTRPGLLKALAKDWRGGVLCEVVKPGLITAGAPARILSSPPEINRRLP
ncbi:MAG: MOSC domain-containing protein [Pseudomonadota bacterium]